MENQPKKRWGDRPDGRKARKITPYQAIIPFMMPKRCDAEVFLREKVDVTELKAYLEKKNASQDYRTTLFHAVLAAAAKTVFARPLLNRFVSGKHYYDRDRVTFCFLAKRKMADHAEGAEMIMQVYPSDTIDTISRRIVGEVDEVREGKDDNGTDNTMEILAKIPRCIMTPIFWVLNLLERYGWLPKSFMKVDPYHVTMFLSNLGSIQCDAAYHHLANFGTNSLFATIGYVRPQQVQMPDGSVQWREIMELCFTVDERIADGFYFARSIQLLKSYLTDPAQLDLPFKEEP